MATILRTARARRRALGPLLGPLLGLLLGLLALPVPASALGGSGTGPVAKGQWSFMVYVERATGPTTATFCGGAMIGPREVLTAAHCVTGMGSIVPSRPSAMPVVVGTTVLSSADGEQVGVAAIDVDPAFDPVTLRHDAAVLYLVDAPKVHSIALATWPPAILQSLRGTLAGWGRRAADDEIDPDRLLSGSADIESPTVCALESSVYDQETQVCTGSGPGAAQSCEGDSGGPLVITAPDGTLYLAAIVSYGTGECGQSPTYYTAVTAEAAWLASLTPPAPAGHALAAASTTRVTTTVSPAATGLVRASISPAIFRAGQPGSGTPSCAAVVVHR